MLKKKNVKKKAKTKNAQQKENSVKFQKKRIKIYQKKHGNQQ